MTPAADPLGLYLSVPFCRSKCSFCNFASNVYSASHHARYVERVCEQLHNACARATAMAVHLPRQVDTIYLGGGTPSVLAPELLHQLFAAIRVNFTVSQDAEITMECAPGQIEDAVLAAMSECGVNRVSLGVQSFIDREAATTGRLHNCETTLHDIDRLRAAGIQRISLDLIAGLPHQTLASWRESLSVLTSTGVQHASIYMLEIDDESRLGKELLEGGARYHAGAVPKDDTIATMFEIATGHLEHNGIMPYEISNYAVAGQESKHNLKYWRRQPYLGVGLDAHSMLRSKDGSHAYRFSYTDSLTDFIDSNTPWQDVQKLTQRAELEEAWFLGLRLSSGVRFDQLKTEFGEQQVAVFLPILDQLHQDGFVRVTSGIVTLTPRGKLLSNDVFAHLLEAELTTVGDTELCPAN